MKGFSRKISTLAMTGLLTLATLAGTTTPARADKDVLGLIGGAIGGGFIGNTIGKGSGRTVATATGAVLGGIVGQSVGRSLDRADRSAYSSGYGYYDRSGYYDRGYSSSTVYYSEPAPQRVYYVAPSYERRVRTYEVVPAPANYTIVDNSVGNSGYCREYNQNVTVGGRTQSSYGTACLQPDGSWKIQQ